MYVCARGRAGEAGCADMAAACGGAQGETSSSGQCVLNPNPAHYLDPHTATHTHRHTHTHTHTHTQTHTHTHTHTFVCTLAPQVGLQATLSFLRSRRPEMVSGCAHENRCVGACGRGRREVEPTCRRGRRHSASRRCKLHSAACIPPLEFGLGSTPPTRQHTAPHHVTAPARPRPLASLRADATCTTALLRRCGRSDPTCWRRWRRGRRRHGPRRERPTSGWMGWR